MLDETDEELLDQLRRDARRPVAELARKLGLPRTTVQDRLQRLEDAGVIRGYVPILDHGKLGNPVTAIVLASFQPGPSVSQKDLARRMAAIDGIAEVHMISGEWDLVLKVRAPSIEAVGELVTERIRTLDGVARTVTCASFFCPDEEADPPPRRQG